MEDEYLPARNIQTHAMLFRAGCLTVDEVEGLIAKDIKDYRAAGINRVSKADPAIVGSKEK